jgi:hypothetical protein
VHIDIDVKYAAILEQSMFREVVDLKAAQVNRSNKIIVDFILARILFSLNITTILSAYIWELTLS